MSKKFAPIVIITVAAVALFLAGCSQSTSGIPGVSSLTLNPNCKYNDPDLCKFVNNFKDFKDYSSQSQTTSKQGKSEQLFESSGDNKSHMATTENGKETYNLITIGDTTYTKDYTDNKWWKQVTPKQQNSPAPTANQQTNIKDEITKSEQEDKTTYQKIDKEPCGGLTCFKYQVLDPQNQTSKEFLYFDDKEYLLRKTRSEASDGSVTESQISYKVSITAPSPTKDAKPDQIILPTGSGNSPQFDMSTIQQTAPAQTPQDNNPPPDTSTTQDTSGNTPQ